MSIAIINQENFRSEVLEAKETVLLDFWAPWCGPCRMIAPILEEISAEDESVVIGKVNVDEEGALSRKFRVMSIPTLKLFTGDEEPRATFVGAMSQEELVDWLAENGVE